MIAELYASGYNGTKGTRYHRMLVYKGESLDTDEEPLLDWIIATTPKSAVGGESYYWWTMRTISLPPHWTIAWDAG